MATDAINTPTAIDDSEDALYDMSMDELEKLARNTDIEQPDDEEVPMDSDGSDDNDEPEVDEDTEPEEEAEVEPETDDQPAETEEVGTTDTGKKETYVIPAVGTKIECTLDELKDLASRGADYTKKMQEISPWRKQIEAMREHNVSQDDINMLIDIKAGKKEAILNLVKQAGIDPLDIDLDSIKYTPSEYGKTDADIVLRDTVRRLAVDGDVYSRTEAIVDSEWDSKSRQALLGNPSMIEGLHNDVKSGLYDKVMPEMVKMKMLDGGRLSDVEYYIKAGAMVTEKLKQAPSQVDAKRETVQKDIKDKSALRKAAALPRARQAGKKDVINYMDEISDDDYKAFLKKVEGQY